MLIAKIGPRVTSLEGPGRKVKNVYIRVEALNLRGGRLLTQCVPPLLWKVKNVYVRVEALNLRGGRLLTQCVPPLQ